MFEAGEALDAEDADGKTPLALAEAQRHTSTIAVLKGLQKMYGNSRSPIGNSLRF